MSNPLKDKLTGRVRHRVETIGWWNPKQVLILQHEVEGFVATYAGGMVDGGIETWWVDSKPEWVLGVKDE
jgi:hypothetical protein